MTRSGVGLTGVSLLLASSCGPDYPKQPPIDLSAQASPVPSDFSSESVLATSHASLILPFYETGRDGAFAGVAGVPIHYRVFVVAGEKGAIALLPGRNEPVLKYAELIWDLTRQGYSVYAMDHRGQGASGRMTSDPQLGYVEFFIDYVRDAERFVQTIVAPDGHTRLFVLTGSMGGGIAALYLYEKPHVFQAAALMSPMLGINLGALPDSVAHSIANGACDWGADKSFAFGQGDFDPDITFSSPENDLTRSEMRFNVEMQMFRDHPELRVGGVSWRWLCESFTATARMQTLGRHSRLPTLLLQAGKDTVVSLDAQDQYCDDASRCQMVRLGGGYHEIWNERDAIRNQALTDVVRFFDYFAAGGT